MPVLRTLLYSARWHWLRSAAFAALILVISWLAFTTHPPKGMDTGWDKSNHLLAFGTLLVSLRLAWPRLGLVQAFLVLLGYGVFIELVQSQIPGRDAELADLLADSAGIAVGLALHALILRVTSDS